MSYNLDLPNLKFIDEFSPIIVEIPKARQIKLTEPFISETDGTIIDKVTGFLRRENESMGKGFYIRPYKEAYEHMINFIFTPFNKNDQSFKSNQTNAHKQGDTLPGVSKTPENHKLPEKQKLSTLNELDKCNENKDKGEEIDEDKDEELDDAYLRPMSFLNGKKNGNGNFKDKIAKIYRSLKGGIRRKKRRNKGNGNERKGNEELEGEYVKAASLLDEENENKDEEIDNENENKDEELGEDNENKDKGEEIDDEIDEELDAAYLRALSFLTGDEDDNRSFKEGLEKMYRSLKVIRRNRRRNQRRNGGNRNEKLDGKDVKAAPLLGDEENENKDEELGEDNENENKDEELGEDNENENKDEELGEDNENENKDEELGEDNENENKDEELGEDNENENKDEELGEDNENENKDEELGEDNENENKDEELGEDNKNKDKGEEIDDEIDEELDAAYLRALSFLTGDEDDNRSFIEGLEKIYRALKVIRRNRRRNQRRNGGNRNERKGNEELDGEDVKAASLLGDEDNENEE
ncbi:erythrocyte membrane antigen 1 [Plasmodium chabaudi chabaudi]|nr:erythrocyte membrane antigen 1 [Plasmodium chabaudi chabaudi]VTZ68210.1 erythrocyte membrane antigen 1 [Plasmodium chabaudi chabaudi]|eukprot:XP_745221.1 erythrocyte membrane antigen 1 [Plasmodium chabaudi chabaudi]